MKVICNNISKHSFERMRGNGRPWNKFVSRLGEFTPRPQQRARRRRRSSTRPEKER
uniref:Uncharacterized protein n=1 Tax=Timema tahoe TaxID=61484 RepID=A0A7R9IT41_9NEOP|nr:unnamed protein product [Timema tahoe]